MSQRESPDNGVVCDVHLTAPLLPCESLDRLEAALHRADRNLGVIVGNPRKLGHTRLELLGVGSGEDDARSRATSLMEQAAKTAGLAPSFTRGVESSKSFRGSAKERWARPAASERPRRLATGRSNSPAVER